MLSIKPLSSADAAGKYYSHGDYYGSEGEGTWLGEGAKKLGLSGNFTAKSNKEFNNLLHGILPCGAQLGRESKDGIKHRPGIDLTFSAPKSFSIEMMINSDPEQRKNMEAALMNAVSKTLGFIEKEGYIFTRKKLNGTEIEKLDKLAFAAFMHTTNRNLEPQAHVHCFLTNVAICKDGKFRSITVDNLLENNKLFGQIFRNELALETKKLGHELKTTILSDGSSSFELSNIHPKMIDAFSTRRKEIVELYKQYGVTTKEGRDKIVINSRKAKKLVTSEELSKTWSVIENNVKKEIALENKNSTECRNEIKNENTNASASEIKDKSKNELSANQSINHVIDQTEDITARDLTQFAIDDTSYNKTIFTQEELLKNGLKHGMGSYSVYDIQSEMKKLEKIGVLIRHENQLTTKALLDKEKQILKFAKSAVGSSKPIIKKNNWDNQLKKFKNRQNALYNNVKMNNQQEKAIKHIITSTDKIITMEGLPGVGKSTVLNAVRDITGHKIINLVCNPLGFGEKFQGSAPTASATKTLKESAGIESQTLHSFVTKYSGYIAGRGKTGSLNHFKQEYKNTIIFLDEASMISTNIMHKFLTLQQKFGFRSAMTGDTKQHGSVEAGNPFEQMLNIIKPVKLNTIVRQKDQVHRNAIIAASEGRVSDTFRFHNTNINQIASEKLAKSAAKLYLDKSILERNNSLIISPTKILRDQINNEIIKGIQKENSLTNKENNFQALIKRDFSKSDYSFAYMYNSGDIVKFNRNFKGKLEKNEYLKVKDINHISNSILFEKDGKDMVFKLNKNTDYSSQLEVFEEKNLKLQEGLKIIFTKNNKEFGLVNSETAQILKIDSKQIKLGFETGIAKFIPIKELKHINYGYCVTVHSSQGKTFNNTIAAINNNKLLATQKMWLVAISRHKNEFTALVENKDKLKSYLINNTGAVMSATELESKTQTQTQIKPEIKAENISTNHKSKNSFTIENNIIG